MVTYRIGIPPFFHHFGMLPKVFHLWIIVDTYRATEL